MNGVREVIPTHWIDLFYLQNVIFRNINQRGDKDHQGCIQWSVRLIYKFHLLISFLNSIWHFIIWLVVSSDSIWISSYRSFLNSYYAGFFFN